MKPILFDCKEAETDSAQTAGLSALRYQGAQDITVTRCVCTGDTAPNPHTHEGEQTFIVVQGKGLWLCDGVEYELDEGCIATIPAGCEHSFIRKQDCDRLVFYEVLYPKNPSVPQSTKLRDLQHVNW